MIDSLRDAWVERARAVTIEAEARRRGLHLQKQGDEFVGPCPVCRDGHDRFSINPKENAFYCRKCDRGGRDALSLVAFIEGLDLKLAKDFAWACQTLTGEEPPDVASKPNGSKRGNSDYPGKPAIVETFDYENADGELSYKRQRVEFDGDDGERAGMKGGNVRRLLPKMVSDGEVLKGKNYRYAHPDKATLLDTVTASPQNPRQR